MPADRFAHAARTLGALLEASPTLDYETARVQLTPHGYAQRTLARAWAHVQRARAQPDLDILRERLHEQGIHVPPAAASVPPVVPPVRAWPSDTEYPTPAFIDAYSTLAAAYEHKVTDRTREVYYRTLVRDEGCTVDECAAAVPFILRSSGTWPRIHDWLTAIYTVRHERQRRAGTHHHLDPQVDAEGNAVWDCTVCRDTHWKPACGCSVGDLVAGFCERHPRTENKLSYRPRYVRCACQQTRPA